MTFRSKSKRRNLKQFSVPVLDSIAMNFGAEKFSFLVVLLVLVTNCGCRKIPLSPSISSSSSSPLQSSTSPSLSPSITTAASNAAESVTPTSFKNVIEFTLGSKTHIQGKVPINSSVQIHCPQENPIWYKNGIKLEGFTTKRRKTIGFEKIKKTDSGTYACKFPSPLSSSSSSAITTRASSSQYNYNWSNLTLSVLPESIFAAEETISNRQRFPGNVEAFSHIQENLTETNGLSDDNTNGEIDDIGDDGPPDDTKFEHSEGSPPTWKNETSLIRILPKPSGTYIKIPCAAVGNPKPNITWTKDGKKITRLMGKVITKKWTIQMEDTIPEDSGSYTCTVCNTYGCIEHTTKLIIQERIRARPIINEGFPKNETVLINTTVNFECKVIVDLEPHIIWVTYAMTENETINELEKSAANVIFKNSSDKSFTGIIRKLKTDPEKPDILTIENVTYEDEGWYTCIAANSLGTSTASAYLQVVDEDPISVSLPVKSHSVWISVGTTAMGVFFLFATIFIGVIYKKLKHEKLMKHRMETVHQWTKKVIIYKPSGDPNNPQTMVMPIIKIEKQRTTLLQSTNTDPAPFNEYEFPLDSNWEIPRHHLTLGPTLGEGAFGRVVKAECAGLNKSNQGVAIVAVKMVKEGHTDADMASLVREMEVMKMIGKHVNIINLLGCCSQDGPLYVIVEFALHGNLKDFLKKNRPVSEFEGHHNFLSFNESEGRKTITQKDLISFAFQVARGMEYLASRRCIHRDLAARNVLVSEDYVMKIADFGLARDIQDTDYYRKNTNGRLPIKWMAPESLQDKFYDIQSDVWSYGILLWEIMTFGEQPYPSIMSAEELYNYLMSGQRMEKPPRCSLNIYMLMRQCWNFDAHSRPTFAEIVENLDKILAATANVNEEYLDLGVPLLETPPSSDEESDAETIRETSFLRYKY